MEGSLNDLAKVRLLRAKDFLNIVETIITGLNKNK